MPIKFPRIGSDRFPFEKCAVRQGISQLEIVTSDFKMLMPGCVPLGWCYSKDLRVRPRTSGVAILVEITQIDDEDEENNRVDEAWIHASDEFAVDYCDGFESSTPVSVKVPSAPELTKKDWEDVADLFEQGAVMAEMSKETHTKAACEYVQRVLSRMAVEAEPARASN